MSTLTSQSNALYLACLQSVEDTEEGMNKRFTQQDLEALSDCSITELTSRVNELVDHSLLRSVRQQQQLLWILRTRETASKLVDQHSHAWKSVLTVLQYGKLDRVGANGVYHHRRCR